MTYTTVRNLKTNEIKIVETAPGNPVIVDGIRVSFHISSPASAWENATLKLRERNLVIAPATARQIEDHQAGRPVRRVQGIND